MIHMPAEMLEKAKEKLGFDKYDHLCDLYNTNPEFKAYVDKCVWNEGIHKDILFLHKTIQDVADYYEHKYDDVIENDICPCGLEIEDKAC